MAGFRYVWDALGANLRNVMPSSPWEGKAQCGARSKEAICSIAAPDGPASMRFFGRSRFGGAHQPDPVTAPDARMRLRSAAPSAVDYLTPSAAPVCRRLHPRTDLQQAEHDRGWAIFSVPAWLSSDAVVLTRSMVRPQLSHLAGFLVLAITPDYACLR
jgi:hypothetical protein